MCYCPPKANRRQGSVGKHSFTVLIEYRAQGKARPEKVKPKLYNYLPDAETLACFKYAWVHIRVRCDGRTIDEYEDGVKYA